MEPHPKGTSSRVFSCFVSPCPVFQDHLQKWTLIVVCYILEANFSNILFTYNKRALALNSPLQPLPPVSVFLGSLCISIVARWVSRKMPGGRHPCHRNPSSVPLALQRCCCRVMQRERNFSSRQSHLSLYRSKNQHLRLLAEIISRLVQCSSLFREHLL